MRLNNSRIKKQFFQFSIATMIVATVAGGIFAWLMRLYGVHVILPWAVLFAMVCGFAVVGKWMVLNIQEAQSLDPSTPRKIATFNSAHEAGVFVSLLAERGVRATAVGGFVSSFQAESPGYVDVMVPNTDYERSVEIAQEIR